MLTGKPPFQSSTQDEIYRRAKELDYEWPAVDNEIGDDAKDLVKSMLRPPEQRPDCDQIVKHSFFSSGFVPEMKEILPEFLTKAPDSWKFKSGRSSPVHAKNYQELCMKSDVGPWGVPQKMQASLYKEMQAEEKYGLTPSIPLPEGFVYRPFIEVYRELMAVQARRDNHATRLIEREGLDRLAVRQMPTVAGGSTQSYAAQQRAQHQPTLSSAPPRRPKSNTEAESVPRRHPQLDEVRPELSSGERREAPAADTHVRSTFSSVGEPRRSKRQPELTAMSHERKSSARARDDVKQETVNGLSRKVSSSSRTTTSPAEDRLTEGVAKLSIEQTRTRTVLAPKKVLDTILSPTEHTTMLRGSQPDEVLERLRKFHSEISRALKARSFGAGKRAEKGEAPLVVKWVDYTNKFGLGYILNDGTVGCFFRSMPNARNPEKQLPPISVVVRNCERHLQRREDKTYVDRNQLFPITDAADVEFYENRGDSGIMNVKIAAKTYAVSTQPGKVGRLERGKDEWDNKKRENIVLWKKFANYMIGYGRDDIQPTEEDEEDLENVFSKDNVVIFYQRFGDVGVWGFSNGSYQVSIFILFFLNQITNAYPSSTSQTTPRSSFPPTAHGATSTTFHSRQPTT